MDLDEVVALVKAGISPLSISLEHRVPHSTVVDTIHIAVGHGLISKSEILYAIDTRVRCFVDGATSCGISTVENFKRELRAAIRNKFAEAAGKRLNVEALYAESDDLPEGISPVEYDAIEREGLLYFRFCDAPASETYECICRLERYLHDYISRSLIDEFRSAWWLDGIPEKVRLECVEKQRRAQSVEHPCWVGHPRWGDHPYCYATFANLRDILATQWPIFGYRLPANLGEKDEWFRDLARIDEIRNLIVHPGRGYSPAADEFLFVRNFVPHTLAVGFRPAEAPYILPSYWNRERRKRGLRRSSGYSSTKRITLRFPRTAELFTCIAEETQFTLASGIRIDRNFLFAIIEHFTGEVVAIHNFADWVVNASITGNPDAISREDARCVAAILCQHFEVGAPDRPEMEQLELQFP